MKIYTQYNNYQGKEGSMKDYIFKLVKLAWICTDSILVVIEPILTIILTYFVGVRVLVQKLHLLLLAGA